MNCIYCDASVLKKPQYRTGPIGEAPGWACIDCIKEKHPEIHESLKKDNELNDIVDVFYPPKT